MFFASDNTGPVHPKVMEALVRANADYVSSYGADPIMDTVRQQVRDIFEAPQAAIYLVATGTAANSIILATMAKPWETVFCSRVAHIHEDECGCPEFFTGGSKLTLIDEYGGKMAPDALKVAIEAEETRGVHGMQRGPVSITQATERGVIYTLDELRALTDIARSYGMKTHMDGARFTNAMVALGCAPADMTWKAGIDAVSFGGTKNGLMGVEAVILFDPEQAWEFELRRKRSAHLFSKHRYLSAQMQAYLTNDLWIDLAKQANGACARLTSGLKQIPDVGFHYEPDVNMIFAEWSRAKHQALHDAGAQYYVWSGTLEGDDPDEKLTARLVCDWSTSDANTDRFLEVIRA
ncbi:threonine aldolase family protein [Pseudaestuariivita rosea]|uniref:threonine aldolase family protein n=1 Tax=Pseudaestuariivita rosea TaxID=2763263 RepID=UPI001ABA79D1|nr:beta-eliminating lyase-related protein [Pseudaestuariivita rosea]